MFPLGFMLFILLQVLQWINHETSENISDMFVLSNIGIKSVRGYKYTIKTIHKPNQLFIANSDQLQLSPPFLMQV